MSNEFTNAAAAVRQSALDAMDEAMKLIQADTQMLCPVKTGTLRRSYQSAAKAFDGTIEGAVGSNVEYAIWADLKTPHLTRAVDQNIQKVQQILKNALMNGGVK